MADTKNTAKGAGQRSADAGASGSGMAKDNPGMGKQSSCGNGAMGNAQAGNASRIRERMSVVGSCGTRVGVVDHVEGGAIKLTKSDSRDGQHHFIPVDWVERVDNEVHLKKNSQETEQGWKSDASACGSCGA
jgi:hypothetical protein